MELADTSAWTNRHKDPRVQADFDARVLSREIATCPMVTMELLWTTRTPREFGELWEDLAALPQIAMEGPTWQRAVEVWQALVDDGRQREVRHQDLLIAAAAELAGVPLCHYDRHFEVVAEVTRQPERAIAPLGTL